MYQNVQKYILLKKIYVGSMITNNRSRLMLMNRLATANSTVTRLTRIRNDTSLVISTKLNLLNLFNLQVKHGYLPTTDHNKINMLEMWAYRRMLRISWKDWITKKNRIIQKLDTQIRLLKKEITRFLRPLEM